MKKNFLLFISFALLFNYSFAQWSTNGTSIYNTNTGNVGIGTSAPSYKFEVAGLLSSSLNGQSGIHIYNGGGVTEWLIQQKAQTNHSLSFSSLISGNQYDYLTIGTNGNIGAGTTNLQAKFNVYQNIGVGSTPKNYTLLTTISGSAGTSNNFQNNIWLVRNSPGSDWYTVRLHDGISIDGAFQTPQVNTATWWERDPSQNTQSWGSGSSTYLSIINGNVGIGTTDNANWQLGTSIYKLAVNGSAIATSVTVKASGNWPDYVFLPSFKLPLLKDVKAYIDQNHHLPEIPSELEVKDKGLNLGEMNKLLLKKVEELTLYLIEKDKHQAEQDLQIKNLQMQVAALLKDSAKQ